MSGIGRVLHWPTVFLAFLVGGVTGMAGFTFWYAKGYSYLSDNPQNCVNCHIMREQYDSWQKASHHAVATCNDCHLHANFFGKWLAKSENGFWHSKGFTLQDFEEPIRIKPSNARILQENCLRCHGDIVAELVHQGAFGDGSHRCVDCHISVGNGQTR